MTVTQKIRCLVEKIVDHGGQVYTIDLFPERKVPRFRPGQFLHLALDEYDPSTFWPESRTFSIASSPLNREHMSISYSVKGCFTARMERELEVNRWVWIKLPYGEFVLDNTKDVALSAGGTGITAFTAFLASLPPDFPHRIYLFYGARDRGLLIYRSLVIQKVQTIPNLHASFFVEQNAGDDGIANRSTQNGGHEDTLYSNLTGKLSVAATLLQIQHPYETYYYLSGPPQMIKVISKDLAAQGVLTSAIKIDAWE